MIKVVKLFAVVCVLLASVSGAGAVLVFSDNWNDLSVQTPAFAAAGVDWYVEPGGRVSADATAKPPGFLNPISGTLMFSPYDAYRARVSVTFGRPVPGSRVEARFKLHQTNNSAGYSEFWFGMKDTVTGNSYEEQATPNPGFYGVSGFHGMSNGNRSYGEAPGSALTSNGGWDYLKMVVDPSVYDGLEIYQASDPVATKAYDDPSLTYTVVARMNNYQNITSIDHAYFTLQSKGVSWMIDDVEIDAMLEASQPPATPAFTPGGGSYTSPQTVTISCATPGAIIRYTTDGSIPTETNGAVIASGSSIIVSEDTTLQAKAFANGLESSRSADYRFNVFLSDTWDDLTVTGPTLAPAGVDWAVEAGTFAANAAALPEGFSFLSATSRALMFNAAELSQISVNFPGMENSPVQVRFKLRQTDASPTFNQFGFGFKNTASGLGYEEQACPNPTLYGTSGFHNLTSEGYQVAGDVDGSSLTYNGSWDFFKFTFDPANGIELWRVPEWDFFRSYDHPSLVYVRVAHWPNFLGLTSVNQFYFNNSNFQLSWMVDDLEINGKLAPLPPAAATPTFTPDAGAYLTAKTVVIGCETPGATIRYTTDGSIPSETNGTVIASGSSVLVDHDMTLKAKAWAAEHSVSAEKSAAFTFPVSPVFARPNTIPYSDDVTIDGDLSDWSDAQWAPLDQTYDGTPTDIAEGAYAAKWGENGNKVYVAVKVRDTAHSFLDSYGAWNTRDAIEIYIHTTGIGDVDYSGTQADAQQYAVGIKNSDHSSVWAVVGTVGIPAAAGFSADGSLGSDGWIYYEAAMTPFHFFALSGEGLVVSKLSPGQIIGVDVVTAGHYGTTYTGMTGENTAAPKFADYNNIGLHLLDLKTSIADAKGATDGTPVTCSGVVSAVFTDFLYIEAADRAYGIRVNKANHGRSVGQIVDAAGAVQTLASGERAVVADDVVATTGSGAIAPLALNNKTLGGGQFGRQEGVAGAAGLNTIGLLVKTTGRVGTKGTGWFMIDDGSGVSLKVIGSVPTGTPYVAVTGASSCEKDGSNEVQRVIIATQVQEM